MIGSDTVKIGDRAIGQNGLDAVIAVVGDNQSSIARLVHAGGLEESGAVAGCVVV